MKNDTREENEQSASSLRNVPYHDALLTSKSSEWYTKPKYIEAARLVMDGIDLDPASCAAANRIVKARRYFTKEQNGLIQDWTAESIWLNPPYGRTVKMQGQRKSTIRLFTEKLIETYEQGKVKQAIILATTEINAAWFYPLWNYIMCVPDHRVHFIVPEKLEKYCQMFGTCFVYLGTNEQKFIEVFSQFGRIAKAIDTPRQQHINLELWEGVA